MGGHRRRAQPEDRGLGRLPDVDEDPHRFQALRRVRAQAQPVSAGAIRTREGGHIDRGSRIPFDHWWTNPVVKDADGAEYSRKDLVLALASSDLTDPEVEAAYAALAGSESLGWVVRRDTAATGLERNPVMASVRQIGFEVLQSISQQRDVIAACA